MQETMEIIPIKYIFTLTDGTKEIFDLNVDAKSFKLIGNTLEMPPPWTRLGFHQCPNCPLTVNDHPNCPISVSLVNIVKGFSRILSYDEVNVKVVTRERTVFQKTTAQRGLSSLMGLVIATSECPLTDFFKPMAYFHLPFASDTETIWRAAGTYLLAQYFLKREGKNADLEFDGLNKIYENIQDVNASLALRLCAASEHDSTVNAIILLDMFAKILQPIISGSLEKIRHLLNPILKND